ncbi:LAFE_0F05732g1_1 [Lachancea fermentati]|uniref:LAFE_0F05732g1_1 n=1 Tax=Lachancea fermentati TaxID=4955 RepID=A0A1G4MF22_LACFM|nr:LAFE_0F05732g1_1 [Lachancea fermentati]
MSEFINENPDILDENQLPSRKSDDTDLLLGAGHDRTYLMRKQQLLRIHHKTDSSVMSNVELINKLLITEGYLDEAPELTDEDTEDSEEEFEDPIDAQEIYDMIAHISDPEHPLTLGQLAVVNLPDIVVRENPDKSKMSEILVKITPTITHCSLATLIGLGIRVRLERCLSPRYRITILLKEGSHQSENQVNKQLNDKERVAAACENDQLLGVVSKMLATCK